MVIRGNSGTEGGDPCPCTPRTTAHRSIQDSRRGANGVIEGASRGEYWGDLGLLGGEDLGALGEF